MATNFFDFREQITPKPAARAAPSGAGDKNAITVTQLTSKIDGAIRTGIPGTVIVKGEISRPNLHRASGHLYFTLKDAGACIDAVMWKSDASKLKFQVDNGQELIATGRVQVYAPQGKYQLYVSSLAPVGIGALELALKQLRAKLEAEGLFAVERKKALPVYPKRIAIVTSRSTAALQDMLKVLRRFPFLKLFLYHVPVQGEGAGQKIAAAIGELNRSQGKIGGVDLILLGRGGGSMEDLWQFNEEAVARAISLSAIPIVTGIGHEIDTSIADLVADYHAHTPTEAATVAIANWSTASELIVRGGARLHSAVRGIVLAAKQRLASVERHELFRRPTYRIEIFRQMLDHHQQRLHAVAVGRLHRLERRMAESGRRLERYHPRQRIALGAHRLDAVKARLEMAVRQGQRRRVEKLDALAAQLRAVSPMEVLRRGYSITTLKKNGRIIRSAKDIVGGERVVTRLGEGEFESIAKIRDKMICSHENINDIVDDNYHRDVDRQCAGCEYAVV